MRVRIQAVQELRGIAFMLIFISHCNFLTDKTGYWGACGVSLFIVLSGAMAGMGYEKIEKRSRMENFVRKLKPLYPLHIVTLIASIPISDLSALLGNDRRVLKFMGKLCLNIVMLQGLIPRQSIYFSFNAVSWYLTLVLIFALVQKTLVKWIRKVVISKARGGIAIIVIALVQCLWTWFFQDFDWAHWMIYINPLFRVSDFAAGVIIGLLFEDYEEKFFLSIVKVVYASLLCGSLALSCLLNDKNSWFLAVFWMPFSIVAVFFALHSKREIGNILTRLGDISMELFLVHQLVIRYMLLGLTGDGVVWKIGVAVACMGVSILIAFVWRNLKKRCKKLFV